MLNNQLNNGSQIIQALKYFMDNSKNFRFHPKVSTDKNYKADTYPDDDHVDTITFG